MDAVAIDLDGALGALERLLERLGPGALVLRSADELSVQSQRG
jgi:hypothetical protein